MHAADFDGLRGLLLEEGRRRLASKATRACWLHSPPTRTPTCAITTRWKPHWKPSRPSRPTSASGHSTATPALGHALLASIRCQARSRGLIDFADAEWLACRLLQSEDYAPALALKLDARYRHLRARRIPGHQPAAMAGHFRPGSPKPRRRQYMTVFMVGDPSTIVRFRRGEATVFDAAADFLHSISTPRVSAPT